MNANPERQSADPLGLIGQIIAERFRVTSLLGRGGFGVVYRAEQLALERTVALKVQPLPEGIVGSAAERLRQELKDEARTVARLRHPHIVEVFDFGVSEGASGPTLLWMVMEWLDGQTLAQALAGKGQPAAGLAPRAALDLLRPVLEAVSYAHAAGVVHRDLKPANVFLVENGARAVPKVLDFGIARWLEGEGGRQDGAGVSEADVEGAGVAAQTTRGFAAFSPDYAAPEQISHSRTGPFTDVHALGLMLTEVLTGRPPYEAVDAQDRYAAVVDRQRPTPASKGIDVGAWEVVLARALARRPADRFQDAGELLQALEGALRETAAPAAVVPAPEAPARRTIPDGLPAKLLRPQTGESVPRPRLWKALDRLGRKPITWVQGPGGAGKTTLVSSYLRARGGPVLWYEVDAGDADPGSVYHYLRLGAQAMVRRRLALPTPRPGSPESQRIFARRFFESLFAQLPAGTRVVFDNYQEAALAPGWNDTFRELASVITPRVRVLVASRSAPPPALARLAASGELQVLDWEALRFDEQEIQRLVKGTRGARKGSDTSAEVARLRALTDGWAVAVSLLARAAPGARAGAAGGQVKRPGGRRPAEDLETVFAFLASEILARLDGPTRQFLQQVAMLPSFTPEMATALTGRSDSTSVLSRLYGDNLLIEWRGEDEFSLHQLFRMFLQAEARRALGEDGYKQLARRAGALLARVGDLLHAGELLAAGEAWPELAALIEQQAPALAEQGRLAAVGSALQLLPPALRDERPWLVFWQAAVGLGHPGPESPTVQARRAFERLRQAGDPVGPWIAWALAVQAIIIEGKDFAQLGLWLKVLEEMGAPPPIPPVLTRLAAAEALAYSFFEIGTPRALVACERALEVVWRHGSVDDRILVSGAALMVFMNSGRPDRAREMVALTRRECMRAKSDPLPRLAFLHAESAIAFQSAEFRQCMRVVDRGLALARDSGIDVWNCSLITLAVLSARACGDFTRAERLLEQMAVPPGGPTFARGQYMFCRGLLAIERGQAQAGAAEIREADRLAEQLGFKFVQGQGLIALVISEFHQDNPAGLQQARARLDALQAELPSLFLLQERRLLELYMRLRAGEDVAGELRLALADERESGMCSGSFLGNRVMTPLLELARRERIEPAFTARLIRAFGLRPARRPVTSSGAGSRRPRRSRPRPPPRRSRR